MRCIEIAVGGFNMIDIYRLIETWDVLKLVNCNIYVVPCWINRNMRCIEISAVPSAGLDLTVINRNMRCIEMLGDNCASLIDISINRNMRCIEIIKLAVTASHSGND